MNFMKNKMLVLLGIFVVLFSFRTFSQSADTSKSPLLDKYYPQAKQAPVVQAPVTRPVPEIKQSPAVPNPVVTTTPVAVAPKPAAPSSSTRVAAAVDTTTIVRSESADISLPQASVALPVTVAPEIKPVVAATDSVAAVKPVVSSGKPLVPKVQSSQPTKRYSPTRLGSSSPLYDTYEKNNNGAGSVTTGAK